MPSTTSYSPSWALVSIDFVIGPPASDGNTSILTVVDFVSKTAHFIPLPKLPPTKETAELMLPLISVMSFVAFWDSPSACFHPQSNSHTVKNDPRNGDGCVSHLEIPGPSPSNRCEWNKPTILSPAVPLPPPVV